MYGSLHCNALSSVWPQVAFEDPVDTSLSSRSACACSICNNESTNSILFGDEKVVACCWPPRLRDGAGARANTWKPGP